VNEQDDGFISFEGIDPAVLVHALYRGTRALGLGHLHDRAGLTVDDVRRDLDAMEKHKGQLYIDYFHGRPLKLKPLDLENKRFFYRLYDRDAGRGAAREIVEHLLAGVH
jgi:hypothetical protein